MSDRARGIDLLSRRARRTALRSRANEVLGRASFLVLFPLAYAAAALTTIKLSHGAPGLLRWLEVGAVVPMGVLVGGVLHAALRHRPPLLGALALDRHYGLRDRITNALAFAAIPERERTPMMEAAIDDAIQVARDPSPRRAVPIQVPRDLWASIGLAALTAGIGLFEVPVTRVVRTEPHRVDALLVSDDDVDLFRRMAEDLTLSTTDPAALAGARRFNQLVEDIADRRLDRREVFKRLDELERTMKDPADLDTSALDEALDGIAKELEKSALSKPVSQALAEKRLADAEQAMRDLAKKVENAKKDVDKQRLDALRQAMKKASETVQSKAGQTEAARRGLEETRRRLLEKKNKQGLTPSEQQELARTERQLERLDREKSRNDAAEKQLSGLDKDLAKAAQDLMKELGQGSKDIEKSAEDINRASEQRMSQAQKEELLRRIRELRQTLRQEGQAGRERIRRMMAFGQRAHGGQSGKGQGQGQQGDRGSGMGQGQGKGGKGSEQLVFGQGRPGEGNAVMIAPGGENPGAGDRGESQGGTSQAGTEWGTGHDPNLKGAASALKGHAEDVTAAGADTGQGASSSQVIYGAAERGFTGHGYKKVYTDYKTVAEEALEQDQIPPGYRFYVRRYFQLIRPRD
jgi:hypothetical protein